ncbi:MAG: hypothetical protein JSR80_08525 [Verrucomicrobia bacterium]|nr:hypothetical protein [Verrucomicrobiota bacterium]
MTHLKRPLVSLPLSTGTALAVSSLVLKQWPTAQKTLSERLKDKYTSTGLQVKEPLDPNLARTVSMRQHYFFEDTFAEVSQFAHSEENKEKFIVLLGENCHAKARLLKFCTTERSNEFDDVTPGIPKERVLTAFDPDKKELILEKGAIIICFGGHGVNDFLDKLKEDKKGQALEKISLHEVLNKNTSINFKIENININANQPYDNTELSKKVEEVKKKSGSFLLLSDKEGIASRASVKNYIAEKFGIDRIELSEDMVKEQMVNEQQQAPDILFISIDSQNANQAWLLASGNLAIFCFDDKSVESAKKKLTDVLKYDKERETTITLYRVTPENKTVD